MSMTKMQTFEIESLFIYRKTNWKKKRIAEKTKGEKKKSGRLSTMFDHVHGYLTTFSPIFSTPACDANKTFRQTFEQNVFERREGPTRRLMRQTDPHSNRAQAINCTACEREKKRKQKESETAHQNCQEHHFSCFEY